MHRSPGERAVQRALDNARATSADDVIDAEVVEDGKTLVLRGRAALADLGYDPDDDPGVGADEELRETIPDNTLDTVYRQYGRWVKWCGLRNLRHIDAAPGAVRRFIREHWTMHNADGTLRGRNGQPYSFNTVSTAVYVIGMVHNWLNSPNPIKNPGVRKQLRWYERKWKKAGYKVRRADAITSEESVRIARACNQATIGAFRLAAAARLQFDTGARASEILDLRWRDIRWLDENRLIIHIVWSKTHKERFVPVQAGNTNTDVDPARLMRKWWQLAQDRGWNPAAPVFPKVHSARPRRDGAVSGRLSDEPWDYDNYEIEFKLAAHRAGVDIDGDGNPRIVTSHSNRAGLITALVLCGLPAEVIAHRTGHNPRSSSFADYFRPGIGWDGANLGLMLREPPKPDG